MRTTPLLLAALLASGAVACSSKAHKSTATTPTTAPSSAQTSAPSTAGTGTEVLAQSGNTFSPSTLTIKAGQTVTVRDVDPSVPHNFVVNGLGRSKTLNQGDTYSLTFPKAGTFQFVCTFHQALGMTGTITVT